MAVNRSVWRNHLVFVALMVLLACASPFILSQFYIGIMILLLINLILVTSFRLIATLGLYNFAHVAIAGMGAYTSGLLNSVLHWPFFLTLPLGILVSALTALVIGLPAVRTKGAQFFVITFAAGEALLSTAAVFV